MNTAGVIITFLLCRVHTDQSMVTTIWSKDQCSVYHEVQDLVTTCSLWCVLSSSMTFQSVPEWPDPPFPVLVHPALGKGSGLVHETVCPTEALWIIAVAKLCGIRNGE